MSATKPTRIKKTIIRTRKIRGEESRERSLSAAMGISSESFSKDKGSRPQSTLRCPGNRGVLAALRFAQEIKQAPVDVFVAAAHRAARHHIGTAIRVRDKTASFAREHDSRRHVPRLNA